MTAPRAIARPLPAGHATRVSGMAGDVAFVGHTDRVYGEPGPAALADKSVVPGSVRASSVFVQIDDVHDSMIRRPAPLPQGGTVTEFSEAP